MDDYTTFITACQDNVAAGQDNSAASLPASARAERSSVPPAILPGPRSGVAIPASARAAVPPAIHALPAIRAAPSPAEVQAALEDWMAAALAMLAGADIRACRDLDRECDRLRRHLDKRLSDEAYRSAEEDWVAGWGPLSDWLDILDFDLWEHIHARQQSLAADAEQARQAKRVEQRTGRAAQRMTARPQPPSLGKVRHFPVSLASVKRRELQAPHSRIKPRPAHSPPSHPHTADPECDWRVLRHRMPDREKP